MTAGPSPRYAAVLTASAGAPLICRTVQGKVMNTAKNTWAPLAGTLIGTAAHAITLLLIFGGGKGTGPLSGPLRRVFGWGPADLYLGTAFGKAAYALASAGFSGLHLVYTRNPVCPLGCCIGCSRAAKAEGALRRDQLLAALPLQQEQQEQQAGWRTPGLVLSLALPSMLAMVAEWWSSEFRALIVGWMPNNGGGGGGSTGGGLPDPAVATAMAANGVLFVVTVVVYQVYKGLAIAAGIQCGTAATGPVTPPPVAAAALLNLCERD